MNTRKKEKNKQKKVKIFPAPVSLFFFLYWQANERTRLQRKDKRWRKEATRLSEPKVVTFISWFSDMPFRFYIETYRLVTRVFWVGLGPPLSQEDAGKNLLTKIILHHYHGGVQMIFCEDSYPNPSSATDPNDLNRRINSFT